MTESQDYCDALRESFFEDGGSPRGIWVIDFLPRRVPREAGDRYFAAEDFLRSPPRTRMRRLYERYASLVLRLSCYYRILASTEAEGGWTEPDPESLLRLIETCPDRPDPDSPAGCVTLLFPDERGLLTADGEDLYMTLYNPPEEMLETVKALAAAEGVFVRRGAE